MNYFGKALKYIAIGFVAVFIAIFITRIYIANYYPAEMKEIVWNDALEKSYKSSPDSFTAVSQEPRFAYDDAEEGNFFCSNALIIESANQFQVTVRYNNGTVRKFAEKYGDDINGENIPLDFTLVDNLGNRYSPTSSIYEYKFGIYSYRRFVFDGVDFTDIKQLYLDVYYGSEIDYEITPESAMLVYEYDRKTAPYKLPAKYEITAD